MIDVYHIFKLGVTAGKVLKASKGAYNAGVIFKSVLKPMAVIGVSGFTDAAIDEYGDRLLKKLTEEAK